MKIIHVRVYQFNELSEAAKKVALNAMLSINVDQTTWWDNLYTDAETIGLKLDSFDLERNRHATGDFINTAEDVAEAIIEHHGEDTNTCKKAKEFLDELVSLKAELAGAQRGEDGLNADDIQGKIEDLETDFKDILLDEYADLLQSEYDHLHSDEAIIGTIEANEYEFTGDGKCYVEVQDQNTPNEKINAENRVNEIGMISSIICANLFDEVRTAGKNGSIHAHELISKFAIKFYEEHKDVKEWDEYCDKNGFSDWEECIFMFVENEIKAITL